MHRKILVTTALPYANGPIHLGHMVEHIQTDIWVRFQRMNGNVCYFVCADDAHGTPIMLKAREMKIEPEKLIAHYKKEHEADFSGFNISFDNYHSTHSDENRDLSQYIYLKLREGGHICRKTISQAYDVKEGLFLPDRFVKGECPRCGAPDQYGDSCENCGATYTPSDLTNPVSVLSGQPPEVRESEHLFVRLSDFTDMLQKWIAEEISQTEAQNKLKEWFETGLNDWDISRDAPYFGFEIPDEKDKYFYVWLDAPIGYIASFKNLCDRKGIDFDEYWKEDKNTELYNFIGKDILYFHTLFWPAMLHGAGFRKPTNVFTHGFLTVNGTKMSKSRGTFITARTYLDFLDPDYIRYYYAAKLNDRVEDIDLNLDDFIQRINSDLVGKVVNIASRCAGFVAKNFDGKLSAQLDDENLYRLLADARESITEAFEGRQFSKAMREIMALADIANQYVNDQKPWVLVKDPTQHEKLHNVCTQGVNMFRVLIHYLAPVVPQLAQRVGEFLNDPVDQWERIDSPLLDHDISGYIHLMKRIQKKEIDAIIAASAEPDPGDSSENNNQISISDFAKVDLRTATILEAEDVVESDKLIKLKVDIGNETRQIFAGVKKFYRPEQLIGRRVVIAANLAPRKMSFGISEGMVLAAEDGEKLSLISPGDDINPGKRVS
ncbi:MAG: methionine--tRNA ligase [Acidiferrobacterales bacterium]|nr:methionine--tRNA ligase [Acidiferrobacterales bacterium]